MKIPVLQGLDLSQSKKGNQSPSSGSDAPAAPTRSRPKKFYHSRNKRNAEIVSDDLLDADLTSTPSAHLRSPNNSDHKRNFFEIDSSNNNSNNGNGNGRGTDEDMDVIMMSERRRSLFEPLGPHEKISPESLLILPPPDFDESSYPQGWSIGKKRKLVNVDVVESMRRIAVQEMNRKDREINGLNEQLEEDSKAMEHLQLELQQERRKRLQAEREASVLQGQVEMLMTMLNELEEEGAGAEQIDDSQVINMQIIVAGIDATTGKWLDKSKMNCWVTKDIIQCRCINPKLHQILP